MSSEQILFAILYVWVFARVVQQMLGQCLWWGIKFNISEAKKYVRQFGQEGRTNENFIVQLFQGLSPTMIPNVSANGNSHGGLQPNNKYSRTAWIRRWLRGCRPPNAGKVRIISKRHFNFYEFYIKIFRAFPLLPIWMQI